MFFVLITFTTLLALGSTFLALHASLDRRVKRKDWPMIAVVAFIAVASWTLSVLLFLLALNA